MLGMVTPTFVMSTFQSIVGTREAELALGTARLYNAEQAHNAGLIDILADNPEELHELARREVEQMIKIPFQARAITKKLIRGPLLKEFLKTRDENTKWGIDQLLDPDTQEKCLHSRRILDEPSCSLKTHKRIVFSTNKMSKH